MISARAKISYPGSLIVRLIILIVELYKSNTSPGNLMGGKIRYTSQLMLFCGHGICVKSLYKQICTAVNEV